jgi:hypothetical protein
MSISTIEINTLKCDYYTRKCVGFDQDGNKLQPIFIRPVTIVKVVTVES